MPAQFPPDERPSDPRAVRTQEALRAAVLRLAAEKRVEDISVSELTAAAGVNRTTFYRHADSAADVLRQALYQDFDVIRAELLTIDNDLENYRAAWVAVSSRIAEHIEHFLPIYRRGLGDDAALSPALMRMAAEHFEASMRGYLRRFPRLIPQVSSQASDALELASARFVAAGSVELMRTWVQSPAPRDPADYAAISMAVMPAWLLAPAPRAAGE
jgi:AcrR family transcriptional regulator